MAPRRIDLTGKRFGRFTVLGVTDELASNGGIKWRCHCDCGSERICEASNLKRRPDVSCGCAQKMKFKESFQRRLEEKFIPEPNTGCWLWISSLSKEDGYGAVYIEGVKYKAHRVMYEMHRGNIPTGLQVCHKCDVPSCVNPDHLFLGTHLENMADRDRKGRRRPPKGTTNGFAKLNDDTIRAIRAAKGTQMEIAAAFGTDQTNVSLILRRKRWAHVV